MPTQTKTAPKVETKAMPSSGHGRNVLILGGGFGGIKAGLELSKDSRFNVSLLSEQDNFRYYPTLYHAATGGAIAASTIPLTEIFEGKKVRIIQDTAKTLDRQNQSVITASGRKCSYDILIIALGVVTSYFGIKGLQDFGYGIKSQEEAKRLKDHLHQQLLDDNKPDLNYIVIGGGPTGVELAGALPAYIKHIMKNHGIEHRAIHVDLVEAAPRLMPRMPKDYSRATAKRLRKLGVKLFLNEKVEGATGDSLMVSGHSIASHTVIWTAGVTNNPFLQANEFKMSDHGKALVDAYMQAEPGVYVIGDNADTEFSGMAQTALYDAIFVANHLKKLASGKTGKAYKSKKPISVTPAGPGWAAVQWGGVQIYGKLGWLMRSAADFIAYKDMEPWWKASKHWMATMEHEESCLTCAQSHK